jgi:hypothetical protein
MNLVQVDMTFLDLIKAVKINFAQGCVETDSGTTLDYSFEISPKDFLTYSKQDFKTNDKRGNINALTNAKRAIDCQVDKVFFSVGLDPNNFPHVIEEFIEASKNYPSKKDLPIRLRFLQAMSFAPAEIIAKARLLRNKLEHYYRRPTDEDVSNAIELAELFILATDNKLKSLWDFTISDVEKRSKSNGTLNDSIYICYDYKKHLFDVRAFIGKNGKKIMKVKNTDKVFYYLLRIATSFDYEEDVKDAVVDLLDIIGHPIPKVNINIEVF